MNQFCVLFRFVSSRTLLHLYVYHLYVYHLNVYHFYVYHLNVYHFYVYHFITHMRNANKNEILFI